MAAEVVDGAKIADAVGGSGNTNRWLVDIY